MTPEGKVKNNIKIVLDKYKPFIYYYMPVPGGYGKSTLDYLGCFHGRYFAIEAKRPGKDPTLRQDGIIEDMAAAGARVFRINGEAGLLELSGWLELVTLERA